MYNNIHFALPSPPPLKIFAGAYAGQDSVILLIAFDKKRFWANEAIFVI